jgi:hypothetical protein
MMLASVYEWCAHNPMQVVQVLLAIWALANVVWAVWPRPKSERWQTVWKILHTVFGLIATHSSASGTFTWPSLIRFVVQGVMKLPAPDPFTPQSDTTPRSSEEKP